MDKTAWRAVIVTAGLFAGMAAILVVGKLVVMSGESGEGVWSSVQNALLSLRDHPLGLPAVIAMFCAAAFIGAPQFGLIAAAVVAFGPVKGFLFAWIATMVSCALTFWVGRRVGVDTVRKYGGDGVNRLSKFIGKNDFMASMIVRNVPTAPFIVVNMAFGVSHARFWRFMAGAAIGVLPKTAIVAFGGQAVMAAIRGNPWTAVAAIVLAFVLWAPLMLFSRRQVDEKAEATPLQTSESPDALPDETDESVPNKSNSSA